ncbi:hypothetical protein [Streptomyces aidingensis]|uniref:hypothetical protein n=1 Tax=Streptomyces aidingensis TaxID=910347 RepID=UPI000B855A81|nr:hypothetical protein [Streptomyces aidingensis]
MSWTHDFRDVTGGRGGKGAAGRAQGATRTGGVSRLHAGARQIGFPQILRRRARWVGTRLRHPRG